MKKFFISFILIIISINSLFADAIANKYYQNAVVYHKKNDLKNAMAYYNAAIKKDKKLWQAWLGLGICYYNMKKYRNAQLIFRYVLMLRHGEPTAKRYYNMLSGITTTKQIEKKKKEKKTKGDIMWRSALLPGLGQFYNNEIVKGYAYSIMFLAGVGGIIKFTIDQKKAVSDYENTNYDFDTKFKEAQDATLRVYIPIAITGLVWLLSIFDGYLTGVDDIPVNKKIVGLEIKENNLFVLSFSKNF